MLLGEIVENNSTPRIHFKVITIVIDDLKAFFHREKIALFFEN